MPLAIEITENDIEKIERSLGFAFIDSNRRAALQCVTRKDIQAGPGSGKTTLLVAKLAILSSKWVWQDRGICVLSHTNVARQEVEKKLAHHPTAYKLLNYPHFIGTIQSFVDQFLALPHLRNNGIEVSMVDSERFGERALRLLPKFYKANGFMSKRQDGYDVVKTLRFEGNQLKLGSAKGAIPAGKHTDTYKELLKLKCKIAKEGLFRYDDMYSFAENYTEKYPQIIDSLRFRFPWVFIDEMQDTDSMQDGLIDRLFKEGCIFQKFGDINQAIFKGAETESQSSFPFGEIINLPESKRFCPQIADFATPLTALPQTLSGNLERTSRHHTIFLFNDNTINQVLPAFGDLLLEEYHAGFPDDFVAKAIGFRKNGSGSTKVPISIGDYWNGFQPDFVSKSATIYHLVDFVRKGRNVREMQQECKEAYGILIDGILQLFHSQDAKDDNGRRFTKSSLLNALERKGRRDCFQKLLLELCLPNQPLDTAFWTCMKDKLFDVLGPWTEEELTDDAKTFFKWTDENSGSQAEGTGSCKDRINLYRYQKGDMALNIELATIHSVKGETHTATLVLETYLNKSYDLQKILPFLKGTGDRSQLSNKSLLEHMKRIYVGMTRPKELLCFAIHKEHLSEGDEDILRSKGWQIHNLIQQQV